MVTSRIYYSNLLTQQTFSAFNVLGGAVAMGPSGWSPLYDYSAGGAVFETQGTYTGTFQKDFVIEIQSSTDGTFPNTRWRWSEDGGATFTAPHSTLTPVSGTWVLLTDGLEVRFVNSGTIPQFVSGDYWQAMALRPHGIVKAMDGSRNSWYQSGPTPASSTIRTGWDVGSAQQPTFFALDDHNLPATAVVTLYAHATTLFTESGGFSLVCTYRPNRLAEIITSGAYRYWWWKVVMPASGAPADLRYSEAFLGTGATLRKTPTVGSASNDLQFLGDIDVPNIASRGPHPQVYMAAQPQYTWSLVKADATDDGGKLTAALAYARAHASYTMPPFWFLLLDDQVGQAELYSWAGSGLQRRYRFYDRLDYSVQWVTVIRTVAS